MTRRPGRGRPRRGTTRRRRRRNALRWAVAYALRAVLAAAGLVLLALAVCGCLYLREHLSPPPAPGPSGGTAADGNNSEAPGPGAPGGGTGAPSDGGDSGDGGQAVEPPLSHQVPVSAVVALDPGHGGAQPGCEFDGILEKDITLAVALRVRDLLEEAGVRVVMTREGDEDVSLSRRCDIANDARADLFVSVHCNAYAEDPSVSGLEGYYRQSEAGRQLAERICAQARSLGVAVRNVKEADYQVLRDTDMPAALMEIGYLSCPAERALLQDPDHQDALARAIAAGITATLAA